MINSGAIDASAQRRIKRSAKSSSFLPSPEYTKILNTRRDLKFGTAGEVIFNFGSAKYLASLSPVVSTLLTLVDVYIALINGAAYKEPAILESFTVQINEPMDGLYRFIDPPGTNYTGSFVSVMPPLAAFEKTVRKITLSIGTWNPLTRTRLIKKLATIGDSIITNILKDSIDGVINVEKTAKEMNSLVSTIGLNKRYDNVSFDIEMFDRYSLENHTRDDQGEASWHRENGTIELLGVGEIELKVIISDPLRPFEDETVNSALNFNILNHPPTIKKDANNSEIIPQCKVDKDSEKCSFTLEIEDEDNIEEEVDVLSAYVAENGEPKYGTAYGNIDGFTYIYDSNEQLTANDMTVNVEPGENAVINLEGYYGIEELKDKVTIEYGDPYEFDTIDIAVDLSELEIELDDDSNPNKYRNVEYKIKDHPTKGVLQEIININQVTYVPNDDAEGEDSFTYWAIKDGQYSNPAKVRIVLALNCSYSHMDSGGGCKEWLTWGTFGKLDHQGYDIQDWPYHTVMDNGLIIYGITHFWAGTGSGHISVRKEWMEGGMKHVLVRAWLPDGCDFELGSNDELGIHSYDHWYETESGGKTILISCECEGGSSEASGYERLSDCASVFNYGRGLDTTPAVIYPRDCSWWDHEDPETGEWITCDE